MRFWRRGKHGTMECTVWQAAKDREEAMVQGRLQAAAEVCTYQTERLQCREGQTVD